MDSPDVRYAQSGDAAIAYYVLGDGPRDLVFAPFMISSVFAWEHRLADCPAQSTTQHL
jgi:hypothetical protein